MEKEVERERTYGLDGSTLLRLHSALYTVCLPPQRSPDGRWLVSFFFFGYGLINFKIMFLSLYFDYT